MYYLNGLLYIIIQVSYLFESSDDYALSKDVDVALWLDYRAFNKKEPLRDALDFVIVNPCLHDDFDEFKRKETESDYSYLRVNELLLHYITHDCGHLRERIVTKYGLNYLKMNGDQIDHLCRWVKTKRNCIQQDGFGTMFKIVIMYSYALYTHSLQYYHVNQYYY